MVLKSILQNQKILQSRFPVGPLPSLCRSCYSSSVGPPDVACPEPSSSSSYGGDVETIKAKIISFPRCYSLLTAYLKCNKVGAPPEVSARSTEIAQEVEARQRTALGGLDAATEPELD
jgi:hypothetical protein